MRVREVEGDMVSEGVGIKWLGARFRGRGVGQR